MSHSHSRAVRPAQLLALLLAFLSVSSLMGVVTAGMLVPVAGPPPAAAKELRLLGRGHGLQVTG